MLHVKRTMGLLLILFTVISPVLAFNGEVLESDVNRYTAVLLDNPTVAVTGPWVSIPADKNLVNIKIAPLNLNSPTSPLVAPTSPISIVGIDSLVKPDDSVAGIDIGQLTTTVISLSNQGFHYRWIKAVTTAAQPAGIKVLVTATKN